MTGAFTDGRLSWTACTGSLPSAAIRAAVSSNVRPGFAARLTWTRPEPMSNGSAGVVRFSLTTLVVAVVMIADLIWPGVQVGCRAFSRMAEPAMCGDAMEVPAM